MHKLYEEVKSIKRGGKAATINYGLHVGLSHTAISNTYVHIDVCMCIHACMCTYICVFICIWMYVCECVFIHVYYNILYLLIVSVLDFDI